MRKLKGIFEAIKAHMGRGLDKIDFYVLLAIMIMIVSVWKGSYALAGTALLPAFVAGFMLAMGTEPDDGDDGPDDDGDEFDDLDPDDARLPYDLRA